MAPERLAIDHHIIDPCGGGPLFSALTEVSFTDKGRGSTLMEVAQTYTLADPTQAERTINGAPEGWRQTLNKLEAEVKRMRENGAGRSVVHGAFHLERIYDATAAAVYKGAIGRSGQEPLVFRTPRLAAHRARDGPPGRGYDDAGSRERGTRDLLDTIGASLSA